MAREMVKIMNGAQEGTEYYLTAGNNGDVILEIKKPSEQGTSRLTDPKFHPTQLWLKIGGDEDFDLKSVDNGRPLVIRETRIVLGGEGEQGQKLRKEEPAEPAANEFSYISLQHQNRVFDAPNFGRNRNDPIKVVLSLEKRSTSLWKIVPYIGGHAAAGASAT